MADAVFPRLSPGPHLGFIEGFDDLSVPRGDTTLGDLAAGLRDEAVTAGMSIGRAQVDWAELEPAPGVYDRDALLEALAAARAGGTQPFLTLSTLDSDGPTLPAHLPVDIDAPEVLDAFGDLLAWMTPILADAGVWGLSLGNEIEIPVADGFATTEEAIAFFSHGAAVVDGLDPDLPVSVTFTAEADRTNPDLTAALIQSMDFVTVNYYCSVVEGRPADAETWGDPVRRWIDLADGRPVFLQELGCPAGFGGFEAEQALFFDVLAELILREDKLIGATVFQLIDWSPELAASFVESLRAAGLTLFADDYAEALQSLGLARWEDGTTRPAWEAFLSGLAAMQQVRDGHAIWGSDGDDVIEVTEGLSLIDAGPGTDTVIFPEAVSAELLQRTDDGFQLSGEVPLALRGVDRFEFADTMIVLDGSADALSVARLYAAAFGRDPDPSGATFWTETLAAEGLARVAAAFVASDEFTGRLSDAEEDTGFLALLYENVLRRDADAGGLAFWEERLAEGAARGNVLAAFANSVENRQLTEERFDDGVLLMLG